MLKFFEYDVRKEEYAIQRNGNMLFGVIDFAWDGETCSSLGFHTSTNKALALKIATGARVLVCDNLALSGDLIALYRRHTSHFDLTTELMKAIRRYKERQPGFLSQFAALKDHRLTMLEASGRLLELFRARILPLKLFHQVVKDTAQQERTLWNMLMVTTSAVKQLPRAAV